MVIKQIYQNTVSHLGSKIEERLAANDSFVDILVLPLFVSNLFRAAYNSEIPIEFHGVHPHVSMPIYDREHVEADTWYMQRRIDEIMTDNKRLQFVDDWPRVVVRDGSPARFNIDEFIAGDQMILGSIATCHMCGQEKTSAFQFKDGVFRVHSLSSHKQCYDANPFEVELHYNAGDTILFGDWLGGASIDSESHMYDALIGQELTTRDYASVSTGHLFVGNTSPYVYKLGNRIYIGEHPELGAYDPEEGEVDLVEGATKLGYVCTDLWAVTFATEQSTIDRERLCQEKGFAIDRETGLQFGRSTFSYTVDADATFKMTVFPIRNSDTQTCYAIIDIIEHNK